jgi:hypothetical protein
MREKNDERGKKGKKSKTKEKYKKKIFKHKDRQKSVLTFHKKTGINYHFWHGRKRGFCLYRNVPLCPRAM